MHGLQTSTGIIHNSGIFIKHQRIFKFVSENEYQRTNGPVNAHLRPEIYINKLV